MRITVWITLARLATEALYPPTKSTREPQVYRRENHSRNISFVNRMKCLPFILALFVQARSKWLNPSSADGQLAFKHLNQLSIAKKPTRLSKMIYLANIVAGGTVTTFFRGRITNDQLIHARKSPRTRGVGAFFNWSRRYEYRKVKPPLSMLKVESSFGWNQFSHAKPRIASALFAKTWIT